MACLTPTANSFTYFISRLSTFYRDFRDMRADGRVHVRRQIKPLHRSPGFPLLLRVGRPLARTHNTRCIYRVHYVNLASHESVRRSSSFSRRNEIKQHDMYTGCFDGVWQNIRMTDLLDRWPKNKNFNIRT